jgi:aryl-alcohol dehydrogenase-like predicted oxidoreductase
MSLNGELGGRKTSRAFEAVDAYLGVAQKHGLDPVHMAMAFVRARPFMASAIFGATSMEQLKRIIAGADLVLGDEVMADIDTAHRAHPMPY